jgi:hypothetical protein
VPFNRKGIEQWSAFLDSSYTYRADLGAGRQAVDQAVYLEREGDNYRWQGLLFRSMAYKLINDPAIYNYRLQEFSMPRKEPLTRVVTECMIDEIITGVFFSKRFTGQFCDWDDLSEAEVNIRIPAVSNPAGGSDSSCNYAIVHDFDDTTGDTTI